MWSRLSMNIIIYLRCMTWPRCFKLLWFWIYLWQKLCKGTCSGHYKHQVIAPILLMYFEKKLNKSGPPLEWSTINDQLSLSNLCWNAHGYNCICMLSCEFSIHISQFTIDMRLYTGRFIMHCKNGKQVSSYRWISLLMRPFRFFKTICEDLPHGHGHHPQNGHS